MAFLPETETYDEGVYLIETTDPVVGGVDGISNKPQRNLANRTKYLKKHVDDLEQLKAPLDTPLFSGEPKAPTPDTADETTKLATTLFVKRRIAQQATPAAHKGSRGVAEHALVAPNTLEGEGEAGFMSPADKAKLDGILAGAGVIDVEGAQGNVTLDSLASFARSLQGNGYQCFPGGLMIQWCTKDIIVPDIPEGAKSAEKVFAQATWPLAFNTLLMAMVSHSEVMPAGSDVTIEAGEMLYGIRSQSVTTVVAAFTRMVGSNNVATKSTDDNEVTRVHFFGIGRWK
ncbi:hypothetical protein IAI58_19345 (plasmid) [Roseomonas marmotae]|uniref:hypothetical protein n=1 Tax=Roseomonas marmotae TaxID=2768161 RepID=UPI001AD6F350|nr:hypothetical protein [Roseomonas marmotae]QTI81499.1 hypothetical protein IAI58_19345 [Roseomonas marmotae]